MNRILTGDGAALRVVPSGPTCGGCKHFHQSAKPPGQARDLNQPAQGQCREQLHAAPLMQMTPQGPAVQGWASGYPNVHEDFAACGRHESRIPALIGAPA